MIKFIGWVAATFVVWFVLNFLLGIAVYFGLPLGPIGPYAGLLVLLGSGYLTFKEIF